MNQLTAEQLRNADALSCAISRFPEGKQETFIMMMEAMLLGASLAEQARKQPDAAPAQ
mgnify:CR=1 FL=1